MKKIILATTLVTLSLAASADGWRFAPALIDKNLKFEPSLAITANRVDPRSGSGENAYGLDFNFNCGLIQDPNNRIRTHVNYGRISENGLKVHAFELSPRYMVPVAQGLSIGAGPSLAAYQVKSGGGYDETLYGIGVAGGVNYRAGALFVGADVRYHATQTERSADFDNWTAGVKVGINF
jgi:hypothetical protein